MKLDPRYVAAIVAAAPQQGIEPALLSLVEVKTSGRPFESADLDPSDGLEPAMLYERHVAYKLFVKQR